MCFLQTKKTALHYAAEYQNAKVVQTLIDLGADVNAVDEVSKVNNRMPECVITT